MIRIFIIGIILLLSGCIDQLRIQLTKSATDYYRLAESENISVSFDKNKIEDFMKRVNEEYDRRDNATLYAFVCNYTQLKKVGFDKFKAYWKYLFTKDSKVMFDESLIGGKCWIQNVSHFPSIEAIIFSVFLEPEEIRNNTAFYKTYLDRDGNVVVEEPPSDLDEIRRLYKIFDRHVFFGLASGPSFGDFNELNPFCNNSLRYPVKFITGTENQYLIPATPEIRAACYLDLGYIPIYVFYARNGIPEVDNSYILVSRLVDMNSPDREAIGPVFLFSEGSLTPSQLLKGLEEYTPGADRYTGRVRAQIVGWKTLCPDCIVGLTVPFDITPEELKKLRDMIRNDPWLYSNISIIGFGIDADRLNNRSNFHEMVQRIEMIVKFARDLGKPSAALYMYVPQSWTEKKIRADGFEYSGLDYIMKNFYSIDAVASSNVFNLAGRGLIMMPTLPLIPESMQILLGKSSAVSVLDTAMNPYEDAFSYTLSYCKEYFKVGINSPLIFSSSGVDLKNIQLTQRSEFYQDQPQYREPRFTPDKRFTINDKDDTIFKCVGCFLILNSTQVGNFKSIFNLDTYKHKCEEPSPQIINKIKLYSDIVDLDPPFLRALIEQFSNYDKCHVSFVDSKAEQLERCGHNLEFSDIQSDLAKAGCSVSKKSDYVCGFGVMDVKIDITKEILEPCIPSKGYIRDMIFDESINLCKGAIMLANASDSAEKIINEYPKYMLDTKYIEERYLLYRMILTSLVYDQGYNFSKATVRFFEGLVDELKIVGLTGDKKKDNQLCLDYMALPHFNNYCCIIISSSEAEMVNPYCVKITNTEAYWDFLLGMKLAPGMMITSDPPYSIGFNKAYEKVEPTLKVMSKYFDVYQKCKDCADEKWADNILKKKKQICANLPDLPICK